MFRAAANRPGRLAAAATLLLLTPLAAPAADTPRLEQQREAFRTAYAAAERGDRRQIDANRALLADYLLYPDLIGTWLAARPGDRRDAEFEQYLASHGDLRPAKRVRKRWLGALAKQKRWRRFLAVYDATPARETDVTLACHALTARIEALGTGGAPGATRRIVEDGLRLWLVGNSQPDACDPAFDWLRRAGKLTEAAHDQRVGLALQAREIGLAAYLAKRASDLSRTRVARFKRMRANPDRVLGEAATVMLAGIDPDWLYYGFDQLAYAHPDEADAHWQRLRAQVKIPEATAAAIPRRIALSFARDLRKEAALQLDRTGFGDPELAAWRLRTALRDQDWLPVLAAYEKLPEDERVREPWRYWQARALAEIGESERATTLLATLAEERSYHGFLAADRLGQAYQFSPAPVTADESVVNTLAANPGLLRARELLIVGQTVAARSEWNLAVARLPTADHTALAVLANRWGWHENAIRAASQAAIWDALDIRFPLPWRNTFVAEATRNRVSPAYALGIARSESLFAPDAVSHAGALGLMQIMPRTGKGLARELGIPYRGRRTLFEPDTAIALGTRHLDTVLTRFDGNPVLATAAYNAGAHRVEKWLPPDRALPADAWVDSVPFRETRRYVRRVMMAQAVFDYRLDGSTRRLTPQMPAVPTRQTLEDRASGQPGGAASGR